MTFSDDSAGSERSSVWSDSKRRFFQKRYLLSWILAAILPFILLRLLFVSEIAFPFQSEASGSPTISLQPEENVLHEQSPIIASSLAPAPGPEDVMSNTTIPESPLIRPDEDAWITHDDWINHNLNRTQDDKIISAGFENSPEFMKDFSPVSTNGEDFGLPEDNEKEELQHEATEMIKKGENMTEENSIAAEELRPQEVRTDVENMQQDKSKDEENVKSEGEKRVEVNEEILQQNKSQEVGKIKEDTTLPNVPEEEQKPLEQVDMEEDRPQQQREEHEETKPPKLPKLAEAEQKPLEQVEKEEDRPQQQGEEHEEAQLPKLAEEEQKPVEQVDKEEGRPKQQQEEPEETKLPKLAEEEQKSVEQVDKKEDRPQQESGLTDGEMPTGECDLFEGEWEHDSEGPLYTNSTCSYIQQFQDCLGNGRPDTEYLYWRWKPQGCDLPRFDAKSFLDRFRGKAMAFAGDSISRNQMQSLLCLLSQVEVPLRTYDSEDDRTNWWLFKEHQFTLAMLWSPYLLKDVVDGGDMGFGKDRSIVYLDVLDTAWTSVMQDFDFMIFSTGQWFPKISLYMKQQEVIGCHYCPGLNLTELSYYDAYREAIRRVLGKVSDEYKGVAIISTFPLSHFENGSWDNGGHCKRKLPLQPLESTQFPGEHNLMNQFFLEEFNGIVKQNRELKRNPRLEILDVTKVSLQRCDGHPGSFGVPHPCVGWDPTVYHSNDCLHWCLPGPIDAWNQVLGRLVDKYL